MISDNSNLKTAGLFLCLDVKFIKMPKVNGDGAEPQKMAISKPIPTGDLKIKKNAKKTEKKTATAPVTPEAILTN